MQKRKSDTEVCLEILQRLNGAWLERPYEQPKTSMSLNVSMVKLNEPTGCVNIPAALTTRTERTARMADNHPTTSPIQVALDLIASGVLSVDQEGRIWRNYIKTHGRWKAITPRRAENVGGKGYLRLTLTSQTGEAVQVMAHRVVWAIAHGTIPPDELQINHDDLNKQNNRPGNLILCTGAENIRHSYRHGRNHPWHKATTWRGKPRVSEETKQEIRAQRKSGLSLKALSGMHGMSLSNVHRICAQGGVE